MVDREGETKKGSKWHEWFDPRGAKCFERIGGRAQQPTTPFSLFRSFALSLFPSFPLSVRQSTEITPDSGGAVQSPGTRGVAVGAGHEGRPLVDPSAHLVSEGSTSGLALASQGLQASPIII